MPIKLKANNGNIDLKAPIKQVGGKVDSVNGMTGDVVLDIPSKTSDLVNDSGFLTEHQSLAEYAKKSELFSKDYNDLTNKPTIPSIDGLASTSYVDSKVAEIDVPTKTSDLVNDSGFLTEHQSLADYAKKSEIPDVSGFLTSIPDEYVTEAELDAKGYLTEHQSLAEYAKKSELFSKDYNDLTNKPTIPSVEGLASTQYVDNKVSEIVVPSLEGYATEQWVEGKGYLTQHQSLDEYAKKSELFSKDYNDLTNKPTIPSVDGLASTAYVDEKVATKQDTLTAGSNITIENGIISASGSSYTLPVADENTLGGVKAKQTDTNKHYGIVYIDSEARLKVPIASQGASKNAGIVFPVNGQFRVEDNGDMFLRPADNYLIGGVKPDGTTTTVDIDGTIHAVMPEPYTLPTASTSTLGGVKVDGTSITIADGVISADLPTKTSELTNDSGFITNEYHDATKQNVLVAGNNITITNDGTISASHPARYIKSAGVSGNTLNLTYNNDTSVVFTPTGGSGGGSGGVSGYAFSSTQTLTDADKTHLKEIYNNKNIHMTIDSLTVVRIMSFGAKRGFVVINTNGATFNQVLVYTVDTDSSLNVISDTFTLFMSYYLAGNSSALSGDIITSENWSQYISTGGGSWQYTSSSAESNLYNAKEMVLYWTDNSQRKHQTYLNFMADFNYNTGLTLGTGWTHTDIYLDADDTISHPYIQYNGSSISANNCTIYFILYKT